jgi:hypothetical protein
MRIICLLLVALPIFASNSITITDTSGSTNTRPFSISRFFVKGEIAAYAQPRIGGTPLTTWQCDKNTSWSDGSLQHAVISFSTTVSASGSVTVDFVNNASSSSAGSALNQAAMLAFNAGGGAGSWGADIEVIGSATCTANQLSGNTCAANAKTMLTAGKWSYWLQGPVVTQVIVEDRTSARSYDMGWGAYASLHPLFVLTFYPGFAGVKIEYITENMWTTALQDQAYSLALNRGPTLAIQPYTKATFTHIAKSRWRKVYWDGTTPGSVNIDYNFAYMISSKALPSYDLTKTVSPAAVASEVAVFNGTGNICGFSNPADHGDIAGQAEWCTAFNTTGGREDIGPNAGWYTRYLYTFDPSLYPVMLGDGAAAGHMPVHLRESATGKFYDGASTVDAFGHSISRHARLTFFFPSFTYGGTVTADKVTPVGTVTETPWDTGGQAGIVSHQPEPAFIPYLITGDWYWLEELYFHAAYSATNDYNVAQMQWSNLMDSLQERAFAWGMRAFGHAALMAPDGSPEKTYFNERISYNAAIREGFLNVTDGSFYDPSSSSPWFFGRNDASTGGGYSNPLHFMYPGTNDFGSVLDPTKVYSNGASSPWMGLYRHIMLGHLAELDFPVAAVQQNYAKNFIEQILSPDYNPYLAGQYRMGVKRISDGAFFTTWAAVKDAFLSAALADSNGKWPTNAWPATYDGYAHIAQAAGSFMTGITDGSMKGSDAYSWLVSANAPNASAENDLPVWAIVPRAPTPTPPTITTTSPLTSGTVGVAYSLQFAATGDTPITWTCDAVPGGLTFTSGGLLSGTPTTPGTSTINVTATNAAGRAGPTGFSLTIGAGGVYSQATGRMTGTIK